MRVERFLKAAQVHHPAVVLGVADDTGLVIVRHLSAAGIPLLALDADPGAPGLHSRLATGRVCPDPALDEEALAVYLRQLGPKLPQRAVLFPGDERYVAPVSRLVDRLEPWFVVPLARWEAARRLVEAPDLTAAAASDHVPAAPNLAVGEDFAVFASYVDAQSRPLAQFTGRGLREHPPGSGRAGMIESVWLPDLAETGLRLLREAGFRGISKMELRRDPDDHRFRPVRIGPCDGSWLESAAACGVDLLLTAYRDAIGDPYLTPRQVEGRKHVRPLADAREGFARWQRGQEAPDAWLRSYRGVGPRGLTQLRDPVPEALRLWRRWHTAGVDAGRDTPTNDHPRHPEASV